MGSVMTARPLVAVELPPSFPAHGRSLNYVVYDTTRNRVIGSIQHRDYHTTLGEHWAWSITVPRRFGAVNPNAIGSEASLLAALATFRVAWDTFPDLANWPPRGSCSWSANNPPQYRGGDDIDPGQGPWLPGREPPGWRPEP